MKKNPSSRGSGQISRLGRRQFLTKSAAVLAAPALLAAPQKAPLARTRRTSRQPNILYIHSDGTGRYLEPYGYAIPSPNLQRLASEGVLFRQLYTEAPTCSPSRAALFTG